jgi:hypothetical protein
LASGALSCGRYRRVDVGDADGLAKVLHDIERDIMSARNMTARQAERLVDSNSVPPSVSFVTERSQFSWQRRCE